jgi:ABC-type nitrate/sulfonate/bicarbonate transport system permease component
MSSVSSSNRSVRTRRRAPRGGGPIRRPEGLSIWRRVAASAWTWRLVTLVIVSAAWQAYATVAGSLLIPSLTDTVKAVFDLLTGGDVYRAFLISNQALAIGFVLSIVIGLPLGLVAARFALAERIMDPYISILVVTPMAALIPILLIALGLGLASRVVLVVVFAVPMVIVNSRAGVRQVDPALIEMARSFGASETEIWRRILLPGALPAVMTGIRLALGRAITGMVIVELLMVSVGIGNLILRFRGFFESGPLYAVVILVVGEALLLVNAVRWLERRVAPWAQVARLAE